MKNKLNPLSKEIQIDLECINVNLLESLKILNAGHRSKVKIEVVRSIIIDCLKKLPVNNGHEIAKYC